MYGKSIYLWKRLLIGGFPGLQLPLNVAPALGAAELSHWLVEGFTFWLRDQIGAWPAGAAILVKEEVGEATR